MSPSRSLTAGAYVLLRIALALFAFVTLFHPDRNVAVAAAAIVLPLTIISIWRNRKIAAPKGGLRSQPAS